MSKKSRLPTVTVILNSSCDLQIKHVPHSQNYSRQKIYDPAYVRLALWKLVFRLHRAIRNVEKYWQKRESACTSQLTPLRINLATAKLHRNFTCKSSTLICLYFMWKVKRDCGLLLLIWIWMKCAKNDEAAIVPKL